MNSKAQTQQKRGLDALRGIGITGIVLYHMFPTTFCGGFLGVPLFFVLSGYLMFVTSSACWRNGAFHIGSYYKKRFSKIFPPLFAMVMAVCCYLTLFQSGRLAGIRGEVCSIFLGCDNWWQIQQNASYFSRMTGASPFTHLWFLAMEIQFYLLWPVVFILYKKGCEIIGGSKMCFVFLALALASAARMWVLYVPGEDPSRVYYGTDTMAFPLLIGIFLGAARQQYPFLRVPAISKKGAHLLFGVFILIICALYVSVDGQSRFVYQGGMFFVSIFFATAILCLESQGDTVGSRLDNSLMSLLGKKSYWIYLWHYPIIILAFL